MKIRLNFYFVGSFIAALASFGMISLFSAPSEKSATDTHAAESNAVPQSVFIVPSNDAEGRDPFYPKSERFKQRVVPLNTSTPAPVVPLVLNGLGGTSEHRLAMINGRTFAESEESEVPTSIGRVTVRCIEIKEKSVVVEVGGERRELPLRSGN